MLTKSNFKQFLNCKYEFWLDHNCPETAGELSLSDIHRREQGYEVERLARTLPDFVETDSAKVEFGKEFSGGDLYAKADIVVNDPATGEIDIYEVKSGGSVKEDYRKDLAFQCIAAKQSGHTVRRAFVITVNTGYLFDGVLDAKSILKISDETEYVRSIEAEIEAKCLEALAFRESAEPIVTLLDYCKGSKLGCRFLKRKFPDIPEHNVSNLFKARSTKLDALLASEILHLKDIPPDFQLTEREAAVVRVERSAAPFIDTDAIRAALEPLKEKYPLNFLDYESFNPAIPKFALTRPYQQMVFQYSLHTIEKKGAEIRHSYHLSRNDGNHPTEEIAQHLFDDLSDRIGTVFIWSEGFETKRNDEIGVMFPRFAEFFRNVNAAVFDLRKIFQNRFYMHPAFRGRDSIKVILPALCPHLSYEGKAIADGLAASINWYHMATGRGTEEEREKICRDLLEYCELDTLAMVEIYKVLESV